MYGMQLGTVRISGNSLRALTSYEITWAAAQSFSTSSPHRILILFFPLASILFPQLIVCIMLDAAPSVIDHMFITYQRTRRNLTSFAYTVTQAPTIYYSFRNHCYTKQHLKTTGDVTHRFGSSLRL